MSKEVIYVDDESRINKRKNRGLMVLDFQCDENKTLVEVEEAINDAISYITHKLKDNEDFIITRSNYNVADRRGNNAVLDLTKMKFRSN